MQKRVTLSLDSKIFHDFQEFCRRNDVIVSKRVERLIKEQLEGKKKVEA